MVRHLLLLVLIALSGCSFSQTIAEHAVDYNKTVAESDDAQTLLNILRARERRPLHFTAVRDIQGRLTQASSGTVSITIPFGGDAASNFPLSADGRASEESSPIFNIDVLGNSPEFVNAVLTPIDLTTAKVFWDQGWPKDVLIYLLVESIEVHGKKANGDLLRMQDFEISRDKCNDVGRVVENDPEQREQFSCFSRIVEYLLEEREAFPRETRLKLVRSLSGTPIGSVLEPKDLKNLDHLLKVQEKDLSLIEISENEFQLCRLETKTDLCVTDKGSCDEVLDPVKACEDPKNISPTRSSLDRPGTHEFSLMDIEFHTPATSPEAKVTFTARLRSLLSVLYYIGEMVRQENDQTVWVWPNRNFQDCSRKKYRPEGGELVPLFEVNQGKPTNAAVTVDHDGGIYWVPNSDRCTRSLLTLAFLNQVFGLYQSRADLPAPALIQTIPR